MPDTPQIAELVSAPQAGRDLGWLKVALQTALELEFATIPPYLCAMWAIKSGAGRVYDHLREVVMEEMLHLGLVANMLTTIGETPAFHPDVAPTYPCPLPGGARPSLTVSLGGLTRERVKDVFMEIEKPQHDLSGTDPTDETDPTIGEFYTAIQDAFDAVPEGAITKQRQLARTIDIRDGVQATLFKIESKDDARRAIHIIKEQGEGTATSPLDSSKSIAMDLAHYFRFAEVYHGKELVLDPMSGTVAFTGPDVSLPDTYLVAEVPAGGYSGPSIPLDVTEQLADFDKSYTKMLKQLQEAWALGQLGKLNASVGTMFALTGLAAGLMQAEISPGGPTYCPCFRVVG